MAAGLPAPLPYRVAGLFDGPAVVVGRLLLKWSISMIVAILSTVGVLGLAVIIAGCVLPNPDAERIARINARRERERIHHRERAARRRRLEKAARARTAGGEK